VLEHARDALEAVLVGMSVVLVAVPNGVAAELVAWARIER
jgi:hypothetical protein